MTYLILAAACSPDSATGRDETATEFRYVEESDTDTDTDTDTDADSDTDTDTDTDTAIVPEFDCKAGLPPSPPYDGRAIEGSNTTEDLDIDNQGYIIGSDRIHLYRSDGDGSSEMIMPNVGNPQATIVLPTDDIVVYEETCQLERLAPDGSRSLVATNLYLPFGDVNPKGTVYAANPDFWCGKDGKSTIVRIDPFENVVEDVVEWDDDYPWGITFNEDYTALYVSVVQWFDAFMDGPVRIYKVDLDASGGAKGEPELWVEFEGGSFWTEGLAVDVCGNVYASLGTRVVRVMKDTKIVETIWEDDGSGMHSGGRVTSGLAFGRKGEGGTDPMKLYASHPYGKQAIEIDAGVYGKSGW